MSFFARSHYQSDATLFLQKLKEQKPHLDAEQVKGRHLLWDKNVDHEAWKEYRAAQVAQQPYVYQTRSTEESN